MSFISQALTDYDEGKTKYETASLKKFPANEFSNQQWFNLICIVVYAQN
jgi:hypothetical protein